MDIRITVDKHGLLLSSPQKFDEQFMERFNQVLINGGRYLHAELQKNTPVGATGNLRREWKMDVVYVDGFSDGHGGRMVQVNIYNPAVYIEPTEYGRRASPISKEGRKSLELWVTRKLGKTLAEAKSIAFLIARKKALHPTKGQHFVYRTLGYALPLIAAKITEEFGDSTGPVRFAEE